MHADSQSVYILDLDGTILSTNSFPHWVLYLARARFPLVGPMRRFWISSRALTMLLQRKLRLSGHEHFKWRLQKLWQSATYGDGGAGAQAFADRMVEYVRPELVPVLSAVADGRIDALMATAAPADYADRLGFAVGFAHVLATSAERSADDLPLIGVCDDVHWFGSDEGRAMIVHALPNVAIRSGFAKTPDPLPNAGG